MKSDKVAVANLCSILKQKEVKHIVLCPGSRNAPIIASITDDPYFKCYSIVDERSAGFFALGIAQMTKNTVCVVCTSGSAALNFAPAVAEAYYQRLPLLVISADRPTEWVNQGESQTLNQAHIYANYIRKSFDLAQEPSEADDLWFQNRQISEAINATRLPYFGPVHINMRFKEPLYNAGNHQVAPKILNELPMQYRLGQKEVQALSNQWKKNDRVMIICGQMFPDTKLQDGLIELAKKGVVVLTESTSNLSSELFFPCIDKIIVPSTDQDKESLKPTLLISIGGPLISRKVKTFLREHLPFEHWHVDPIDLYMDGFKSQTQAIKMQASEFVEVLGHFDAKMPTYINQWNASRNKVEKNHTAFMSAAPFSDMAIVARLLKEIPKNAVLQVSNSSSIRYLQLFAENNSFESYANRGTSGIDGSISTAVGASLLNDKETYLISGDLSILYDSNGFWNNYVGPNLKTIVLNNGGGGIFRIIEGPKKIEKFETYIETTHHQDLKNLAAMHGLSYFLASDEKTLEEGLKLLKQENKRSFLLEIKSPRKENDQVLMNYFEHLKK